MDSQHHLLINSYYINIYIYYHILYIYYILLYINIMNIHVIHHHFQLVAFALDVLKPMYYSSCWPKMCHE